MAKAKPISLRAYAKRRGVSPEAVSKAIESGRLSASITRVRGAPKIADPELADREWDGNTRPSVDRSPPPDVDRDVDDADYHIARARREVAAARREAALADMAELDLAERRGALIEVDQARADVIDKFTIVRTRILGVPARVAQRMPALASEVVPVLEEFLREGLEELADALEEMADDAE